MLKKMLFFILIFLFSCKATNDDKNKEKESIVDKSIIKLKQQQFRDSVKKDSIIKQKYKEDSLRNAVRLELFRRQDSAKQSIINDSNTIDSLFIGAKFHKFDAFKGYKYVDKEKSEFIETNSDFHSSQLIVLENEDKKFLCLISGDDLMDKHFYWENMESTINDIYEFDKNLYVCWYPNDKGTSPTGTVAIGVNTKKMLKTNITDFETISPCTLIQVDYKKGKIIIKKENTTIYCSDGY